MNKVFQYYWTYYRDDLALPGWEQRIESFRRNEEKQTGMYLEYLSHYIDVSQGARRSLGRRLRRLGISIALSGSGQTALTRCYT